MIGISQGVSLFSYELSIKSCDSKLVVGLNKISRYWDFFNFINCYRFYHKTGIFETPNYKIKNGITSVRFDLYKMTK